MAVYQQSKHHRTAEHVVDAMIGFAAGAVSAVVLWLLWLILAAQG